MYMGTAWGNWECLGLLEPWGAEVRWAFGLAGGCHKPGVWKHLGQGRVGPL